MFPTAFDGETRYLSSPEGVSTDECAPLSIADLVDPDGRRIVLSCWKLTKEELEEVNRTGQGLARCVGDYNAAGMAGGAQPNGVF